MARARTQPGRNSCSSEMMVDTVAVQPKPQTTSSGIATHRSAPATSDPKASANETPRSPSTAVGRQVLLDPAQAQRADHGTEAERREQQPVAVRVQAQLPARDQRQQRPHRAGGHDEGGEAQQDPSDHRLVPHVAPTGHQSRQEGLPLTVR